MILRTMNLKELKTEDLKTLLELKYKEINSGYKMLRRLSSIEAAKKQIEEIWRTKSLVSDLELELMRRECINE